MNVHHPSPPALPLLFFSATAPTEIYTLSLHDALPIFEDDDRRLAAQLEVHALERVGGVPGDPLPGRSEEHTSELQSRLHLVCRLLLEKKKKRYVTRYVLLIASLRDPLRPHHNTYHVQI